MTMHQKMLPSSVPYPTQPLRREIMKVLLSFAVGVLAQTLLLFTNTSHAVPIVVNFTLTVDTVDQGPLPACAGNVVQHTFGCANAVGNTYAGNFTVDNAVLIGNGLKTGVPVSNFFLQIGTVIWNQSIPSDFQGFRGLGIGSPGPGMVASGGALVDLAGGVYGAADIPFVDFSNPIVVIPPNRFSAFDGITRLNGCLTIGTGRGACATVPEPGGLLLFLIGVLGLVSVSSKCRKARHPR
jgi:hypothetical protein